MLLDDNPIDLKLFKKSDVYSLIKTGNTKFIKKIIKNTVEISTGQKYNICKYGTFKTFKLLVEKYFNNESKLNINSKIYPRFTLHEYTYIIHLACRYYNCEAINFLIDNGANLDASDFRGYTPIHIACIHKKTDIIKLLIEKNVNINISNTNGYSPIHQACFNNDVDIVKMLIEKNINLEAETKNRMRPIHYASQNSNIEIVKLLINNKVDINARNVVNLQPIHFACINKYQSYDIVRLFIENNAEIVDSHIKIFSMILWQPTNFHFIIQKKIIQRKIILFLLIAKKYNSICKYIPKYIQYEIIKMFIFFSNNKPTAITTTL